MTLAFIGIGNVGFALANNLQKKGIKSLLPATIQSRTVLKKRCSKTRILFYALYKLLSIKQMWYFWQRLSKSIRRLWKALF